MHPYVALALETIREHVSRGKVLSLPSPLPPEFEKKAGAFVSIKKHGELRGCVGTIIGIEENLAGEIIRNAISASCHDTRFPPVAPDELDSLTISVDVLSEAEKVESLDDLDPKKYGLIVSSGRKRGLLLPDLQGVDTPDQQVEICKRKGGIGDDEEIELYRFTVERYR